jgi:tetratricopeptide (TPR) repeat protein
LPKASDKALYVLERALSGIAGLPADRRAAFFRWFAGKKPVFVEERREEEYLNKAAAFAVKMGGKSEFKALFRESLEFCKTLPAEKREKPYVWMAARMAEAAVAGATWGLDEEWKALSAAVGADGKGLAPLQQVSLYGGIIDGMRFKMDPASAAGLFRDVLVARSLDIYSAMAQPDRDQGIAGLVDRLRTAGQIERAQQAVARIADQALALWKTIELLGQQEKFAEMAKACEDLEKMDNKDLSARALRTRADLYRDRLARYDDAVKLYNLINDPPGTIWAIIDCYERGKKPEEAINACAEIENFFEKDAPAAALRKAQIWERAGNQQKSVAACRAVLKKYPKHAVSSQAHQMLERFGVATGGGVIETDQ